MLTYFFGNYISKYFKYIFIFSFHSGCYIYMIDLSQKNITNKSISESKTPLYFNMEEFSS